MPQSYATAPGIRIVRGDFRALLRPGATVTRIATGFQFTEGPVWLADQGCLVFSDIPAAILYRWEPGVGHALWRQPPHHTNGNTVGLQGRLVSCQHGTRTRTRSDAD